MRRTKERRRPEEPGTSRLQGPDRRETDMCLPVPHSQRGSYHCQRDLVKGKVVRSDVPLSPSGLTGEFKGKVGPPREWGIGVTHEQCRSVEDR